MTMRAHDGGGLRWRSAIGSNGMEAGFLEGPFGPIFAAYSPPAGASREAGLVFCDPFGSDRMNLHLAYRALALHLAGLGFPVLRLDYPGTCDSAGSPRDEDQVSRWFAALDLGADWLKRRAGVAELGAFGALYSPAAPRTSSPR